MPILSGRRNTSCTGRWLYHHHPSSPGTAGRRRRTCCFHCRLCVSMLDREGSQSLFQCSVLPSRINKQKKTLVIKCQAVCFREKNRSEHAANTDAGNQQSPEKYFPEQMLSQSLGVKPWLQLQLPDARITTIFFEGTVKHGNMLISKHISKGRAEVRGISVLPQTALAPLFVLHISLKGIMQLNDSPLTAKQVTSP